MKDDTQTPLTLLHAEEESFKPPLIDRSSHRARDAGRLARAVPMVIALVLGGILTQVAVHALWPTQASPLKHAGGVASALPSAAAQVDVGEASPVDAGRAIVVDVHGDVKHPGIYSLPPTARLHDAVAAAGGFMSEQDAALVNGAAPLDDGSEVVVPNADNIGASQSDGTAAGVASKASNQPAGTQLVDINSASEQTLETLPGVGPSRAQAILRYRAEHGLFQSVDDIGNVPGIGQTMISRLAPYLICLKPNAHR